MQLNFRAKNLDFDPQKNGKISKFFLTFWTKKGKFGIVDFFVLFLNEFRKIRQR